MDRIPADSGQNQWRSEKYCKWDRSGLDLFITSYGVVFVGSTEVGM